MSAVVMTPVVSSNIAAIGHDPIAGDLHVQFKNGGRYIHHGVPISEHTALMLADSKGTHYADRIRGRYSHTKLDGQP